MKTRPILFSGEMVKAILEGRKTQTRRVCKPRYDDKKPCQHYEPVAYDVGPSMERHCEHGSESTPCQFGVVGDRLWVREAWRGYDCACAITGTRPLARYRADGAWSCGCDPLCTTPGGPWSPSIHMPRWASRITLEITGVRVERVQNISVEDVFAEGAADKRNCFPQQIGYIEGLYAKLWDSINAKSGFGWDVNPWVWVVEFKRVDQ